jgi:hypothetical protein
MTIHARWMTVVLALAAAPAVVAAQPGGMPPPVDDPMLPTDPEGPGDPAPLPPDDVPPPPEDPPAPPPPPPPAPPPPVAEPVGGRPDGYAVGVGIGYDFPADLQGPNEAGVRFRLASGLTIEPRARLSVGGQSNEVGGIESSVGETELLLFCDVRLPVRTRGKADFLAVVGGGLGFAESSPDGDDNNTRTITFDVHWGLGVEYWLSPHWVISLTGTNPAFTRSSTTQEQPGDDSSTSRYEFGAIFAPNVVGMVHLFF